LIRKRKYFSLPRFGDFLPKLIYWLYGFDHFSFFNGNAYDVKYGVFHTFAAAGAKEVFIPVGNDPFDRLKAFFDSGKDWKIGRLNYDLKNCVEDLRSGNIDRLKSEEMAFFVPETLIFFKGADVEVSSFSEPDEIFYEILQTDVPAREKPDLSVTCDTSKDDYIVSVDNIKKQIVDGDFYELNYCMEFFAEMDKPDLASIYLELNEISPMPFSAFQGINGQYILSASPERFLKKAGDMLIAQPIKGTMRRDADPALDEQLKHQLKHSEKEMAENMMIIDLMRNDLGRSAVAGSVKVPEMFEIYSYSHVHQMISTIEAKLRNDVHFIDAIKNAWPMGSMTGAPKIRVMEAIDHYEHSKRGMFSGSVGYISPDGDFDFSVLIRSIFYSDETRCLKFSAGSAITYDANPEYEYKECLLKIRSMREALHLTPF
jgi:para-aminobenzoate synthetase component 1